MPITPFHIGFPGLFSYFSPKKIDIFSAILGSIIIDIDFFLFLLIGTPIHGHFHSFLGATIISIILILVIHNSQSLIIRIKKEFRWEIESNLKSISLGAFIGTFSHIIYDAFLYKEMEPFYPINGNSLYFCNDYNINFIIIYLFSGITTFILIYIYNKKYKNWKNNFGMSHIK